MHLRNWMKLAPLFGRSLFRLPWQHIVYLSKQLRYENPHCHADRLYINSFLPPIPSPAFDRLLDAIIHRKRVPFSTYFAVTDQCPYHCPHCSYGQHRPGQMDTVQALDLVQQIKGLGTTTIGFSGGEPLLRTDLIDLVRAVGPDTESIVFTTGHGLNMDLAGQFRDAGLGCIMIGMESDDPLRHDEVRGFKGSFKIGSEAIEQALKADLYTAISTVATREKLQSGQIQRLAEFATRMGLHEFRILEPVSTGRFLQHAAEVLSQEERQALAEFHKAWNRAGKGPAIAAFSHLESEAMFGCGAGYHHLYVDALGHVCPCDLTPISFGNALEEPLQDIWQRMGKDFAQPGCACLAQSICTDMGQGGCSEQLPLTDSESQCLCARHRRPGKLPRVYANLAKHRK